MISSAIKSQLGFREFSKQRKPKRNVGNRNVAKMKKGNIGFVE